MLGAAPAAAATITVDTTADDDGINGNCTLRHAIEAANLDLAHDGCTAGDGTDAIEFGIGAGGPHTIAPTSPLPAISQPVTIDGYTETGASANTLATGNDAAIMIELDGTGAGAGVDGLNINAGTTTVRGLAINGFGGAGIDVSGAGGNTFEGNFIGTDPTGTIDEGNGGAGIEIFAGGHQIGGADPADRNVIAGNGGSGIAFTGNTPASTVEGNYIGTDDAGSVAIPNSGRGISLVSSGSKQIGGTAPGAGNLISGNGADGIRVTGDFATGNAIKGNLIGTDVAGTSAVPNGFGGVEIASDSNTVGGAENGAGNVISGNTQDGVFLSGESNTVAGNTIGLTPDGLTQLGNGTAFDGAGVSVFGAAENTIGGTEAGAGNLIAGNTIDGVELVSAGASQNTVHGNTIGLASDGTRFIGPAQDNGVRIWSSATANMIGGAAEGAGNVISGNEDVGVHIRDAGTTDNTVEGNLIGLDPTGTEPRGNADPAVPANLVYKGGVGIQAPQNTVGGTGEGEGNVIGFNGTGVSFSTQDATGNLVQGNFVGTDELGTQDFGNIAQGVFFSNASGNLIGGTGAGEGNLIHNNGDRGIFLAMSGSTVDNALLGNSIAANDDLGIDLQSVGENPDNVSPNDTAPDADEGPNNVQNFPELTAVAAGSTYVVGSLETAPATGYRIEVFANAAADPTGHGEGETLLGAVEVTTDETGTAPIVAELADSAEVGDEVSATATELDGDGTPLSTSEFSATATVDACPVADPGGEKLIGTAGDDILCGGSGNDKFVGMGGNDLFIGRGGKDIARYNGAAGPVKVNLAKGRAPDDGDGGVDGLLSIEHLKGSANDDRLKGDSKRNKLRGGPGDDLLAGRAGRDKLFGQGGDDVLKGGGGIDLCRQGPGSGPLKGCER